MPEPFPFLSKHEATKPQRHKGVLESLCLHVILLSIRYQDSSTHPRYFENIKRNADYTETTLMTLIVEPESATISELRVSAISVPPLKPITEESYVSPITSHRPAPAVGGLRQ